MKPDRWRRAETLFHAALETPDAARAAFLDRACGGDAELRRRVETLLSHDTLASGFLETPIVTPNPEAERLASSTSVPALAPGERLGPYSIESLIGAGGMGQVYTSRDTRLGRLVAIKVLPREAVEASAGSSGPSTNAAPSASERRARFAREAKTVAGLNHPHICTLYDVGEHQGATFLVMEHVEGETLATRLLRGPLPVDEALALAVEASDGLATAHAHGVVHRDLKPANIMVAHDGHVKVLDFGLAKPIGFRLDPPSTRPLPGSAFDDQDLTHEGAIVGTLPYMSPEQVRGEPLDARSDVFSFGAVLYELLTGQKAFDRSSPLSTLTAVLVDRPVAARERCPDVPPALDLVVQRCLEKSREDRYASAAELHDALLACRSSAAPDNGPQPRMRGARFALPALALLTVLLATVSVLWWRSSRVHWAQTVALVQVGRLLDEGRGCAAFRLVRQAERYLQNDPEIARIRRNHMRPVAFRTNPPGADVYIRDYLDASGPEDYLGRTPIERVFIPSGQLRYRVSKPGWKTAEGYTASGATGGAGTVTLTMDEEQGGPDGMVRVPGGEDIEQFWIDRHEVTNARYKEFVTRGGYSRPGLAGFVDATGRPGPATWRLGTFPAGHGDDPVGGVSWHEAVAYCESQGKSLPTVHHWRRASQGGMFTAILQVSNFAGRGPARVGTYQGIGRFGTYDAAGNVREWCLNASGHQRYILGGAWDDPKYLYSLPDARLPSDRSVGNGFRCVKYVHAPPDRLTAPFSALLFGAEPPRVVPASDEVYRLYKGFHAYDRGNLDARVEATSDASPFWREERVSFRAAYGDERVTACLFLPKNARPPFQTVVTFPGVYAFDFKSSAQLEVQWFDFLIRSGRAVLHPIYKGTYERSLGGGYEEYVMQPGLWRELGLQWYKDLGRSIDYLESRQDIDSRRLAYHGISVGAAHGPRLMALEPRLKAGLLFWGGLPYLTLNEIDPVHFAPRCTTPTLMVNGRWDPIFPDAICQAPMFRLLGAPASDKRRIVVEDAGHVAINHEVIREALAWLDKYLGPVPDR